MKTTILGGGIMGLFSAYYLTEQGVEVTIVEKDSGPGGASMGNAGMVVPSHFTPMAAPGVLWQALKWSFDPYSPFALNLKPDLSLFKWGMKFLKSSSENGLQEKRELLLKLNLESKNLYEAFIQKEKADVGYQPKGLIMLSKTEGNFHHEKELATLSQNMGVETKIMDENECKTLLGGMPLNVLGGVYYPNDAFLTPNLLIGQLLGILQSRGVKFINNLENIEIRKENNKITDLVVNESDHIETNNLLISAGMGSVEIAGGLGIKLPLMSGKGYSITMAKPPNQPLVSGIFTEARIAYTPMAHGLRFAGTLELGGEEGKLNKKRLKGIFNNIPKYFPDFEGVNFEKEKVWTGLRPCTPDGLPIIEKSKQYENVFVCTGHGMMGLSLGPVSGHQIAQLITN